MKDKTISGVDVCYKHGVLMNACFKSLFLYTIVSALLCVVSVSVIHAGPVEASGLDSWVGQYVFKENPEEGSFWIHTITIHKKDGEYYAEINVDGRQTQICLLAKVTGNGNAIQLVFEKHLPDNMFDSYTPRQLLLRFAMQGSALLTEWGKLTPVATKFETTGEYYVFVKVK